MKKHLGWFFTLGFLALAFIIIWESYAVSNADSSNNVQKRAPDFELLNLEGKSVSLSDHNGKIRIVDFWATWCPPCRAEIPHFNALTQRYPELVILGIALDREGPQVVKSFAEEFKVQYPLLMGNIKTVQAFGNIESIPTTFVIDQKGFIIRKYVGYRSQEVFEADIQTLMNSGS
ncbi:MAG: TlpA family protein disulfide reductase [Candidatus Latescibacteria bacterium]|nr:TlpA family protein disulfide reductase [Candidatus Latescibacterota bacterium]MBT4138643.1 TlpA family protein disulfide reductase [Candidatus Latescibacterota bacterium]